MAVDSSFSFLNLKKQHTNFKLKLLLKIETQNPLTECWGYSDVCRIVGALKTFPFTNTVFRKRVLTAIT